MANLDGTDKITPVPFDAHEQVVRGHHSHSAEKGYHKADWNAPAEEPAAEEQKDGE